MQAYQSPPCPYCGVTWNQPGAQACANCRNPLPPPQPSYAPPGYPQGQQPGQGYGAPNYPPQNYPQQPPYPGAPPGYAPEQGYPAYGPPGYQQQPGPYGPDSGYGAYGQGGPPAAAPGTRIRLFGQTFTLPVTLPVLPALPLGLLQFPLRLARGLAGLVAGLIVVLVLFAGVIPAVAAGQISAALQSLKTAASHQVKTDAVFTQTFTLRTSPSDPTAAKAQFDKLGMSVNDGLTLVQSDEAAVSSVDQRLAVLQWVAPSKGAAIADARHRLSAALAGLKQADQGLTAAANELKVLQSYSEARIDYTKISAALAKHDLVAAGAPYPDAQQKIELAISYSHAAGVPSQLAKQVNSFGDVLMNTEGLLQATEAKDAAGTKKYTDAMNAALKAMSTPDESVPADYETKTFGPMQKAYDAAMKAIKSGS
jgi:hypothetical protein